MLPSDILRSKPMKECHEPMVHLTSCDGLFLSGDTILCRQLVAEKLKRVAKLLFEKGLGRAKLGGIGPPAFPVFWGLTKISDVKMQLCCFTFYIFSALKSELSEL